MKRKTRINVFIATVSTFLLFTVLFSVSCPFSASAEGTSVPGTRAGVKISVSGAYTVDRAAFSC